VVDPVSTVEEAGVRLDQGHQVYVAERVGVGRIGLLVSHGPTVEW
jgi:hypothetical protein